MPNRYIRESAIESERINALGWQGEVFYRRLLNRVDDFGRFTAQPELLRASLFPLQLHRVSGADVGKLLLECERAGLVSTYTTRDGKRFLVVHKWEQGRAKVSRYPDPPANICERLLADVNGCLQVSANVPDSDSDSDSDTDNDTDTDKGAGAPVTVYPPELDTPAFRSAWADYLAYRREGKLRPLKPRSVAGQIKEMATWGEPAAIESIRQTIRQSWQGLFAPKGQSAGSGYGPTQIKNDLFGSCRPDAGEI